MSSALSGQEYCLFSWLSKTEHLMFIERLNLNITHILWWFSLELLCSIEGSQPIEPSISPVFRSSGSATYYPIEKANILAEYFGSKQSRNDIPLPLRGHPFPHFNSIANETYEIKNHVIRFR